MAFGGRSVLDVGAGTGIASKQFADRGADVLAVDPDARMAALATAKGIHTELATFEDWQPEGRTFDLVAFAASFHWVDPDVALPKVREILAPRGHLALIWNRLRPGGRHALRLTDVLHDYADAHGAERPTARGKFLAMLIDAGFVATEHAYPRRIRMSASDWIALQFTYSRFLVLEPNRRAELRKRLGDVIGDDDVEVEGDTLAIVASIAAD